MIGYPASFIKASDNLNDVTLTQETKDVFYIEPDIKNIILKLDSRYASINEKQYKLNSAPTIIDGKVYIPLKFMLDEVLDGTGNFEPKSRRVTIKKYGKTILLTEGQKTAIINNSKVSIEAAPIIQDGVCLVPLKFLSEAFNIPFTFDNQLNTIYFKLTEDLTIAVEGNRPKAKFSFDKDSYIAGQEITINDESNDADGDTLIQKQWQIDDDKNNRMTNLQSFLNRPEEGSHTISLRVKDSKRNWSEWYTQVITILPNEKPIVSELNLSQNSLAQGEKIDIKHSFENEEWEKISEEIWSYRYLDSNNSKNESTIGKPLALFYPGKFAIELQLVDAYGNISEKKEAILTITDKVEQSELDFKFKEGKVGTLVDNFKNVNYSNYELINNYSVKDTGAKLLMSNSPESVMQKGVLYKDVVKGQGRILYHHRNMINDTSENKRFVIIMENKNDYPITITKRRQGSKGPTEDILYAGSLALKDFLDKDFYEEYKLKKGETKYLYDTGTKQWNKGATVSGMIEFYSSEQVHITVAMVGEDTQLSHIKALPVLKRDGIHSRGSFENADRYYNIILDNDKPYKIALGKPKNNMENWLQGYDAITGQQVTNKGNYGMIYRMRINTKEDTGILFSIIGNIYKGAIGFTDGGSYAMPQGGILKNIQPSVVAGIAKEGEILEVIYVLPNGSAAPNLFCFIPKSQWNK
jgi:hypothetical protein